VEVYLALNFVQIGGLSLALWVLLDLRDRVKRLEDLHFKKGE